MSGQNARGNRAAVGERCFVERLENREHLSASSFALYDTSFSPATPSKTVVAAGFTAGWWTAASAFSSGAGVFDDSETRVKHVAAIAENGGAAPWSGNPVSPRTVTFMDFEADAGHDLDYYNSRLKWFHQAAPNTKATMIGVPVGFNGYNRDQVINPTSAQQTDINNQLAAASTFVSNMDYLVLPAYMLGPTYVDRDLAWIKTVAADFRKAYPGKPILAWTWGAYQTDWNPPNSVLSDTDTKRYIQACMDNTDGMVVWGPVQDNMKLHSMAVQMNKPQRIITGHRTGRTASTKNPAAFKTMTADLFSSDPVLA